MPITTTLRHFALSEFRHPELVEDTAAVWLDDIREYADFPLVLTSDARTPEENAAASGSSPTSLHLRGRAFDLKYPATPEQVWLFVEAVFIVSRGRPVELELVRADQHRVDQDRHIHIGLFPEPHTSRLLVQAD